MNCWTRHVTAASTSLMTLRLLETAFHFSPPSPPSLTYMTIHDPSFAGGGEEHWANGSLDLERRFRLGSEVTSLSLSRGSSSDKNDPLDNLNLHFKLTSSMRCEQRLTGIDRLKRLKRSGEFVKGHSSIFQSLLFFSWQELHHSVQSGRHLHRGRSLQCEYKKLREERTRSETFVAPWCTTTSSKVKSSILRVFFTGPPASRVSWPQVWTGCRCGCWFASLSQSSGDPTSLSAVTLRQINRLQQTDTLRWKLDERQWQRWNMPKNVYGCFVFWDLNVKY